MNLNEECSSLILKINNEWNKAEAAAKLAEQVEGRIINPAVYELRYAGRRMVEAFTVIEAGRHGEAVSLLQDALFNCMKSRHDSIDAATSKISDDLDIALRNLKAHVVFSCFPKWTTLYGKLKTVRKKVAVSREKREDRDAIYESIERDDLEEIVDLYSEFMESEPLMVQRARHDRLWRTVSIALSAVGLPSLIVSLYINHLWPF